MSSKSNRLFSLFALIAIGAIIEVTDAKPPSRISGASDAIPGVFTWIVSIGLWKGGSYPDHICGGAIISNRHILTAGHCLDDIPLRRLSVRGGITHLRDMTAITANVAKAVVHPDYLPQIENVQGVENDIAILVLDRNLNLGQRLTKVSLPNSPPMNNQRGSVAGWGLISEKPTYVETLTLKTNEVTYLNDAACRRWRNSVGRHYFCGIQETGNVLGGDSGSPLVSDGVVIGVVSSGWGYLNIPDFYTNVYDYRNWINSVLADTS